MTDTSLKATMQRTGLGLPKLDVRACATKADAAKAMRDVVLESIAGMQRTLRAQQFGEVRAKQSAVLGGQLMTLGVLEQFLLTLEIEGE